MPEDRSINETLDHLACTLDARFDAFEKSREQQFQVLMTAIDDMHASRAAIHLVVASLGERIAALEESSL